MYAGQDSNLFLLTILHFKDLLDVAILLGYTLVTKLTILLFFCNFFVFFWQTICCFTNFGFILLFCRESPDALNK